ncbi:MAG: putative membrane protein YecN with MAPEG domain [Gammaproteobacteria bacterium]|jgi:uncharacterized membrane protein YecN with MAPEG domain
MALTPIFAALLALIFLFLSLSVIKLRFAKKVSLGDGGEPSLRVAIRSHANFTEYVPMSLLLLWFVEAFTYSSKLVLILGSVLVVARLAHIIGMHNPKDFMILRQLGVVATYGVIAVSSVRILWHYLPV